MARLSHDLAELVGIRCYCLQQQGRLKAPGGLLGACAEAALSLCVASTRLLKPVAAYTRQMTNQLFTQRQRTSLRNHRLGCVWFILCPSGLGARGSAWVHWPPASLTHRFAPVGRCSGNLVALDISLLFVPLAFPPSRGLPRLSFCQVEAVFLVLFIIFTQLTSCLLTTLRLQGLRAPRKRPVN